MNILNIEHVSKVFGEKVVLDDVSYGVHQGDKIGIIGINGQLRDQVQFLMDNPNPGFLGRFWPGKCRFFPQP